MSSAKILAVASAALMLSGVAAAADQTALATKSGCLACHAVDHKILGPAYKEVAAKYAGDKSAAAKLYEKVEKGGGGVWGQIPMPPNAAASKADIKLLVDWVLSLK